MKGQTLILSWMQQLLDEYHGQIVLSKGRQTVEAYLSDIRRFLEYTQQKGIKRIAQFKGPMIVSYLGYQKSLGKSDASVNRYYMAIKSFFKYLRITKAMSEDICLDVATPRVRAIAPYVPSVCEIGAILSKPDTRTVSGKRDKAILELLYSSGLRASELCDIELRDLQPTQIIVRKGKGSKTRTIPITEQANVSIQAYVAERGVECGVLFQTLMGKKLRRQLLSKIVTMYAEKAGVEGITTHTLRHACATHLLDQGADLRLIQEVLGHSTIASTERYTHLSSTKMQEMFKQFHPRKAEG